MLQRKRDGIVVIDWRRLRDVLSFICAPRIVVPRALARTFSEAIVDPYSIGEYLKDNGNGAERRSCFAKVAIMAMQPTKIEAIMQRRGAEVYDHGGFLVQQSNGQLFRALTMIDIFSRKSLVIGW